MTDPELEIELNRDPDRMRIVWQNACASAFRELTPPDPELLFWLDKWTPDNGPH
jgi:hypothetical protein